MIINIDLRWCKSLSWTMPMKERMEIQRERLYRYRYTYIYIINILYIYIWNIEYVNCNKLNVLKKWKILINKI